MLLLFASSAQAQLPRIGIIDFYGLRSLEPADLAGAVGLQIGDSLGSSTGELRARLLAVPGVRDADVSAVCCEDGRTILYVGIREAGSDAIEFDDPPSGAARLPDAVIRAGDDYYKALYEGVRRGQSEEDDSSGHALVSYPPARAIQEQLIAYAATHVEELRTVLRTSNDARHRALAAQMIAYVPDKAAVVADLVKAVRDADGTVRNNAIRALAVMALYEQKHPESNLHVPYSPFVDLLNSLEWTDRNKSAFALTALTESRDPELMSQLRERALQSLAEMARWRAFGHAAAAGIILGRLAGLAEDQIFPMLQKNREAVIDAAVRRARQ